MKKTVLFLCTHNAARSQIAEGLLRNIYGDRYEVNSAGLLPTSVHPFAITVMKEIGIDISVHRSKSMEEFREKNFDYVVTVCDNAKEGCPFFPGKKIIHKGFTDPLDIDDFRRVRDDIKQWITDIFRNNPEKTKFKINI
ncbi:MAG: arsenate reductase ArsC [Euryarchaeota archaeon]|nr:arsenate reductase ArsC [Euryarchaeota archaeon]